MITGRLETLEKYHTQILSLIKSFRKRKITLNDFSKEVPEDAIYCLLVRKNTLIGMFRYYKVPLSFINEYKLPKTYTTYKQIATVIVDPKFRGKGYGKELMKYAAKLHNTILDTFLSWTPAIKTYLSAGYKIISTKKYKDDYLVIFAS